MDVGTHITQVVLALALIVGLVVALGFVLRRVNRTGLGGNGEIRVVASTVLGARDRILLLEVDGRRILVGVNPGSIRTLAELPAREGFADTLRAVET